MPNYKDTDGNLHFLDDQRFEYMLPLGCVAISDHEADKIASEKKEPKTDTEKISIIQQAVAEYLDKAARAKNYDNIQSAAIRAGFPGPFHDEGVAFAVWMDACWARCYQLLAEVKGGARAVMSADEVLAEMPPLVLP